MRVQPAVIRSALNGDLEQPLGDELARATELRDAAQQPPNVRNITQLVGERRRDWLYLQFHEIHLNKNLESKNRISLGSPCLKKLPAHMLLCEAVASREKLANLLGKFSEPIAKNR